MHRPGNPVVPLVYLPCLGGMYKQGSKHPTKYPSAYEDFQVTCLRCEQVVGLIVGTSHMKSHYAWQSRRHSPARAPVRGAL